MLARSRSQNAVEKMAAAFVGTLTDWDEEFLPVASRRTQDNDLEPELQGKTIADLIGDCVEWLPDFFEPATYKAVYGGRAGAKSHGLAELMLARMLLDKSLQCVVIRKYRAAITSSAQLLLRNKIEDKGWSKYFDAQGNIIKRIGGRGHIAFKGLQGHNATSIKSFENYAIAWVEEATEIDQYSIDQLGPTIRAEGAELWFSWNPDQPTDPVDAFFRKHPPDNAIIKRVSYQQNKYITSKSVQDEAAMRAADPEKHAWVWLGEYNVKSNAIIFAGRWRVGTIDTTEWDGPYFGLDFGFVADPTAAARHWRLGNKIYVDKESYSYGLQIDRIAQRLSEDIPGIERYVVRADSSEQDTIAYLVRHGLPRITPVEKGPGSVETGVKWLKNHEIIVHPDCINFQDELRRYRLKTNKAGDPLDEIVDKDNHLIDQCRYAFQPLIKNQQRAPDDVVSSYRTEQPKGTQNRQSRGNFGRRR